MIFKLNRKTSSLESIVSTNKWVPQELKLEKYLLSGMQSERQLLRRDIFGEELLPIGHQIKTKQGKRADILAIDQLGNLVIIELKRDKVQLGVETQALQYLAEFSPYKGADFINQFSQTYCDFLDNPEASLKEDLQSFTGRKDLDHINQNSRIILIAQSFDPVLFSMGKWFANNNVAFRCMEYIPFEIETQQFIGFSVVFDDSPAGIFPLAFSSFREPQYFWHNIGTPKEKRKAQEWWNHLKQKKEIPASFSNQRGDEGEQLLREYKRGDKVLAYASGFGAVGWGIVEKDDSYHLVPSNDPDDDILNGRMLHRIKISWGLVVDNLNNAISANDIKELGGYHPISTKVKIDETTAQILITEMQKRFGQYAE